MEQWIGTLAVVTGASAGIGAAIAEKLVKAGVIVIGIARRLDRLEELANSLAEEKGQFHPRVCDVGIEEEIVETFQWIDKTFGPISILVTNAGITRPTNLKEGSTEHWAAVFNINVHALLICSREGIRSMRKHGIAGHIVHIGSVSSHLVPDLQGVDPFFNVYPASKHAVLAIAETQRKELRRTNAKIKITALNPGVTLTEIFKDFPGEILAPLSEIPMMRCEDVANACLYVLGTPADVQISHLILRPLGELF